MDFAIGWTLLNGVALWLGHWHWQLVALTPVLLLIQACTAMGVSLVLAMLNAQYRDVKHAVGFVVQVFMLATPVIYPLSKLPAWAQSWIFLNPMAVVVTSYRSLLQPAPLPWALIGLALLTALAYLAGGIWFFRRREAYLADIL